MLKGIFECYKLHWKNGVLSIFSLIQFSFLMNVNDKLQKQMAIKYTHGEEIANSVSHGFGILFGIIMGFFMIQAAVHSQNIWALRGVELYLFGMLSSYITSTWYHGCVNKKQKEVLRKFDHGAIYLHIAGTYSPILLIVLRESGYWGWSLFAFIWLAAAIGFILSFTNLKEHSYLETLCYIAMGGVILVAFKPLINILSPIGEMKVIWLIMAGGISYIIGAAFYSFRKKYMHSIFHLFCLGGSVCHAWAIWYLL